MAAAPWAGECALLGELESDQGAGWLRSGSQDSCRGMEFLFYRGRSEGDVSWRAWGEEDPACIESDFRQSKSATLQWPRSDRNRCEAFSGPALCRHFGTLAPCPTKLLPGWRRSPAIVPARRSMGQWLSAFSGPEIAGPLLFLSRHAPGWMRLGAGRLRKSS